jgi:hypothetical protein
MFVAKYVSAGELTELSKRMGDPLVKGVADIRQDIMVLDADMHADEEAYMIENMNSRQSDLWGFNLWPGFYGTERFVEFDSLINIRPTDGNRSRGISDGRIRGKIIAMVAERIYG